LKKVIRKINKTIAIVCVIPTLNEAITIPAVISKAKKFSNRVVVVDGYSDDGTPEAAFKAGADVIFQEGEGKGNALRTVFNKIYGDVYIIIDGDGTYDAMEIDRIIKPILYNQADLVVGSRLSGRMEKGAISKINKIGNHLFNFLINLFFKGNITDSQSGFRAIHRNVVETMELTSEGFEIETEITIKALKAGLRIREIPISYSSRRGSPSKLSSFKAGIRIVRTILKSLV